MVMQIKAPTFEWLAKIEDGKIQVPKEAYIRYRSLKDGELVYVQIALMGTITTSKKEIVEE